MKRTWMTLLFLFAVMLMLVGVPLSAFAQNKERKSPVSRGPVQKISEYFSIQETTYNDGAIIERDIISSRPVPPAGYEHERASVARPEPNPTMAVNSLSEVPAFRWVFGCSAVSGAMIAGYYDRIGLSNIYTGPTNYGLIPTEEDVLWGSWIDGNGDSYPNNPLIASHAGVDGREERGSIDDYWVSYLTGASDPYVTGGWTPHAWGDAIGDYMKTSQSGYGNDDGSTSFYTYTSSATPLTCTEMESYDIHNQDGTYGRKLFYEAKGYSVTDCYAQKTDNASKGGFSFAQYKAEIDAGRPVLLNLIGHSIVGVGYDDSTATIYIHDTWDNGVHSMRWGGSYSGMKLDSVSIVNVQSSGPDIFVSPASYDFGSISVGEMPSTTFSISNTAAEKLHIGLISIGGAQASEFNIYNDNCSGAYLSSASCTFQVTFAPLSDGSKSAILSIPSNDTNENPVNVPLSGTAYANALDLSGSWTKVSVSGPNKKGIYTVTGTFVTKNTGTLNASSVVVNYYLSDNEAPISTSTLRSISAGSSRQTTIQYSTSSPLSGKYLIAVVDPSNRIAEANEGNNRISSEVIP